MNVEGGSPRALTPEGFFFDFFSHGVTPGGGSFAARSGDGHIWMFDVEEGPGRPVPGTSTTDNVAGVSPDGRSLYIYGGGQTRVKIYRVNMISGARQAVTGDRTCRCRRRDHCRASREFGGRPILCIFVRPPAHGSVPRGRSQVEAPVCGILIII
jgi:hypothetical protein